MEEVDVKTRSLDKRILRMVGGVLGVACIFLGIIFFFERHQGVWRGVVVPLGFIGQGWYFLGYAVTGTTRLFWFNRGS